MELKPCPFCGEAARLLEYPFGDIITCDNVRCPATVSISREHAFRDHQEQNLLIEAWNTRAERTCHDSNNRSNAWQCSECGATMLLMFDDFGEPTFSVDGVADVPHYCPNCGAKVVNE